MNTFDIFIGNFFAILLTNFKPMFENSSDKKKLKRMNESAVSQASVTVATVSTVKADDAAPAAETTAPVSQPSAAYDLYIQYQGADYNAEELAARILEKCKAEGMDSTDLKIYVKPEDRNAFYACAGGNSYIEL